MKENNILANAICEFVKRSEKKGLNPELSVQDFP